MRKDMSSHHGLKTLARLAMYCRTHTFSQVTSKQIFSSNGQPRYQQEI